MELVFVHCVDLPCSTFHAVQNPFNAFTESRGWKYQDKDETESRPSLKKVWESTGHLNCGRKTFYCSS